MTIAGDWLLPPSGGSDDSVSDNAEPEVHDKAPIQLKRPVARQVKGRSQKEVEKIAQNHGKKRLDQVDQQR
jgi:hypothetical protein